MGGLDVGIKGNVPMVAALAWEVPEIGDDRDDVAALARYSDVVEIIAGEFYCKDVFVRSGLHGHRDDLGWWWLPCEGLGKG